MKQIKFLKIGHRGVCGYEPENTRRSFQKAIELGADMVEADVWLTRDKKIVVIHDETVNRTTNGKGEVSKLTLAEVKKFDVGQGEKVPTLEEVLDLINKRVAINIELKGKGTASPVAQVIKKYIQKKNWSWDHFLVSSFNFNELRKFQKLLPEVRVGALIDKIPVDFIGLNKMRLFSVNFSNEIISQELINEAHQRDLKVLVYTINDKEEIQKLKETGVDGIFCDYLDRL